MQCIILSRFILLRLLLKYSCPVWAKGLEEATSFQGFRREMGHKCPLPRPELSGDLVVISCLVILLLSPIAPANPTVKIFPWRKAAPISSRIPSPVDPERARLLFSIFKRKFLEDWKPFSFSGTGLLAIKTWIYCLLCFFKKVCFEHDNWAMIFLMLFWIISHLSLKQAELKDAEL